MLRRSRRNSLAGETTSSQQATKSNMLPPIFSGPNKKNSNKQKMIPIVPKANIYRS